MNISLFIARRLQLKGTKRDTSSSSTIIAVIGVAIAIFVMVLTLTVVLGFKNEIREKVVDFDSQITINPAVNYDTGEIDVAFELSDTLAQIIDTTLNRDGDSVKVTLMVSQPGIIKTDDAFAGIMFKGITERSDVAFLQQNLCEGKLPTWGVDSCKNMIVLSTTIANALNLALGDRVNTYFFSDGNIRARKFEIAGIYNSYFGEYDKLIAYAPMATLQRIAMLDSTWGTSVEITGLEHDLIHEKSVALQTAISQGVYKNNLDKLYRVDNVLRTGAMYFNWLDLLDTNVVVILILMSCVAGITLVSSLFIIILERVKTIGLLKAIGATNNQVRRVFIYMALRLVLRGMIIGNAIGLAFVYLQDKFHLIPLDPEAYYLSFVPVEINWWHMLVLNVSVMVLSSIILILPSHLATKISPAQTMRYE